MTDDETKDDDGYTKIPVHIRLYHDGRYVTADQDDVDNDSGVLDDRAREYDLSGAFREFIVHVRAKRPPPSEIEVAVDVPDEPVPAPASASAA